MPQCLFCGFPLYPVKDVYRGYADNIRYIHTRMKCEHCGNLFLVKQTLVLKTQTIKPIKVVD